MNNRGRLVVDVCLATVVAALALILAPGLGVVAILVGIVVVLCAISLGMGALARRWRGHGVGRARGTRRG